MNEEMQQRYTQACKVLDIAISALLEHMNLIQEQAGKNSAKGDVYWAVYSQGMNAISQYREMLGLGSILETEGK